MTLRDRAAFDTWVERCNPGYKDGATIAAWIQGLETTSWQAPSVPWSADGYRIAIIPVSERIVILYLVDVGDPDQVDLIWIGPEGDSAHLLHPDP